MMTKAEQVRKAEMRRVVVLAELTYQEVQRRNADMKRTLWAAEQAA